MRRHSALLLFAAATLAACSDNATVVGVPDAGADVVTALDRGTSADDGPTLDVASTMDVVDAPTAPDVTPAPDVPADTDPARCTGDGDCVGNASGSACDTATGQCVICTAASDRCPAGEYCVAATHACAAGCRDDASCSSSADGGATTQHCDPASHVCVQCVGDAQCPAGTLCVGSLCVAGCNAGRACPTSQTCCGGACIDPQSNVANCGACDARCSAPGGTALCLNGTCAVGACTAPNADCDGVASNGCETDTAHDVAHCGACATPCAARSHASASCTAGACNYACDAGFADCDGAASNGCEADTRSSTSACGACGSVCNPPNATAACVASQCAIAACASGFGDCDSNATNGCETDVATNTTHCGGCGTACAGAPNAVAACSRGACAVVCTAGVADCDGAAPNGCETDTRTSATHCGGCGRTCALANVATAGCAASLCTVGSCTANFGNCDGVASNGCETDTRTSLANCGACGAACAAGLVCGGSTCNALASCAAIHAALPSLGSGAYLIDPDGAGAGAPFRVYCDMTADGGGWTMVYKLSSGVAGEPSVLWLGGAVNDTNDALLTPNAGTAHYVSRLVAQWNTAGFPITQARVALYGSGVEAAFFRFAVSGVDRSAWFSLASLQASTWTDIASQGVNYFQIQGSGNYGRHWFVNRNYGGCPTDTGWLVVNGSSERTCDWSTRVAPVSIMYARGTTTKNWNDYANVGIADVMAVYAR